MGEKIKIAVNPAVQAGGSLFTPEQLVKIGKAADEAPIEMTSFKQLYMEIPLKTLEQVTQELKHAGLEVYPAGFVTKSLIACQFCRGAQEAGLETAKKVNQAIAGMKTPAPLKIGYAGCALGTSEPLLKDIGIVKIREHFDMYIGGEPKGLKASLATLLVSGLEEDQLVPVLLNLIDYYKKHAKGKEKFSRFVERVSVDTLKMI